MKTSYVSGSNSFLAYNQGGLLNGVDYAANLIIFERYWTSLVEFYNNYEDLLLVKLWVTTGNLVGSNWLTLRLSSQFSGRGVTNPIWRCGFENENVLLQGIKFYEQDFFQPVFQGDMLTFSNDTMAQIDVRRVVFLFRPLIIHRLD